MVPRTEMAVSVAHEADRRSVRNVLTKPLSGKERIAAMAESKNTATVTKGANGQTLEVEIEGELDEFIARVNTAKSASTGIGQWAAEGRLRTLAAALNELADACDAAGYQPPFLAKERQRYERLSDQVGERDLSMVYRAKAQTFAKQTEPKEGTEK